MAFNISCTFEREARLHEEDAEVLAALAVLAHRRAALIDGIANAKNEEADLEANQEEADRLRLEGRAAQREAESLRQMEQTLSAESDQAGAQARRAWHKSNLARAGSRQAGEVAHTPVNAEPEAGRPAA
jgi:hypothetical protein